MSVLHTIRDGVYNPAFYQERKTAPFGEAFGYFLKLNLLAALLFTIIMGTTLIPPLLAFLSETNVRTIVNLYPEDLEITIKSGKASTNLSKEPYSVAFPPTWKQNGAENNYENLLVIDTKSPFNLSRFESYKTAVLLTEDYFVTRKDRNGQISIQKLEKFPDFTLNRVYLENLAAKIRPMVKFVAPVLIILMAVGILLSSSIGNLFLILILSLITWVVEKVRKMNLSYKESYKLGLYAITAPVLLDILLALFGMRMPFHISSLIFLISFFMNVRPGSSAIPTVTT